MFFITKANYYSLLSSLDFDIPFYYGEEQQYISGSKLKSFDLDLSYFTKNEAKALLLSDRLFQNVKATLNNLLIKKHQLNQEQWVFQVGTPSYHTKHDCPYLNSDFINVRIPKSLDPARLKEYREYFIANYQNYGNKDNLRDPHIFMRQLIERFNLKEKVDDQLMSIDQMVGYYFRKQSIPNSEVEEFNLTLDFAKEADRINSVIDSFNELTCEISAGTSRSAYFLREKSEKFKEVFQQRKALVARILNFHFRKIYQQGFDLNETIFELVGFKPCAHCGGHHGH